MSRETGCCSSLVTARKSQPERKNRRLCQCKKEGEQHPVEGCCVPGRERAPLCLLTEGSHENIVMGNTLSLTFFRATKKLKEKRETGF